MIPLRHAGGIMIVIWSLETNVCILVSVIDGWKVSKEGLQKNMQFGTPSYQNKKQQGDRMIGE